MSRSGTHQISLVLVCLSLASFGGALQSFALPEGFVYVEDFIPNIRIDLRYCSKDNFIGRPIEGYVKPRCIITKEAARALNKVQTELEQFGLGLKIYDAYRPKRAVDYFVRWAKDPHDVAMKNVYYPYVSKRDLFRQGYIARRSSHSRGSTVDLTIVSLHGHTTGVEIDMGSGFDSFGPQAWSQNPHIHPTHRAHRLLLQVLMKKHGFKPYRKEWWHFSLKNEPYPETYFDFPVE